MKKIKLFLVVVLCLMGVFALAACDSSSEQAAETAVKSYVSIKADDNEIGLIVDEENKVEDVVSTDLTEEEEQTLEEKVEGEDVSDAIEEIIEEVIDEEKEGETEIEVDAESEDEEKADELAEQVKEIVEAILEEKGLEGKVERATLEEYAALALQLSLPVEQTKMIVLAITLNPSLTIDDVKDLSMSVLIALCDKPETTVVYASYKSYKQALKALEEEYAYIDELEEKVYELVDQLLEDLTDEEFDAICADLKAAKTTLKAVQAEYDKAVEELNTLYADVIKAHEEEKEDKKSDKDNHKHNHDKDFEIEEDDFDEYEEEFEDYFDQWEKYFEEFDWDQFFDFDEEIIIEDESTDESEEATEEAVEEQAEEATEEQAEEATEESEEVAEDEYAPKHNKGSFGFDFYFGGNNEGQNHGYNYSYGYNHGFHFGQDDANESEEESSEDASGEAYL